MKKYFVPILSIALLTSVPTGAYGAGWSLNENGYRYENTDGTFKSNEWFQDNGKWYFVNADGYLLTSQWIDGLYYVGADGAMYVDTVTPDGYRVGTDGKYNPGEQPIDTVELFVTKTADNITQDNVVVTTGDGQYQFKNYSLVAGDTNTIDITLIANEGYYFEIGKASQIKLTNVKYREARKQDKRHTLIVRVSLPPQGSENKEQTEEEKLAAEAAQHEKNEAWLADHTTRLNRIIGYIQYGNQGDAASSIRTLYTDHDIDNMEYGVENGVGLKLYKESSNEYKVYYGGLVDGKREGNGIEYKVFPLVPGNKYEFFVFSGEWHNDAPNGHGTEFRKRKDGRSYTFSGNYVDWYQDGTMVWEIPYWNMSFTYVVVNKLPLSVGKRSFGDRDENVVAFSENENMRGALTLYDSPQTALCEYAGNSNANKINWSTWRK